VEHKRRFLGLHSHLEHSAKHLLLWRKKRSNRFGSTWRWVNYGRNSSFGWTISL